MIITRAVIRNLINEELIKKSKPAKRSLSSYLFEDVEAAKNMAKILDSTLQGGESNYNKFVETLKTAISDPDFKKMIKAGSEEDIVKVENPNPVVTALTPVQKEIGLSNSLGYIAKTPDKRAATLEAAKSGAGGEELKIVTLNGKYIVDGHHRWSQLYMLNPNATIMSYDMQIPLSNPADAMKVAQVVIAAKVEKVPSSPGDTATDIFGALKGAKALKKHLESPNYVDLLEAIAAKGLVNQKTGKAATDKKQAIQMLVDHCEMLTARGTATGISRSIMPQFAPDLGGPAFPSVIPDLTAGNVNWKGIAGKSGDKKEELASRNSDNVILERWAKLAGLIKG